jgi:hypothetical protein
MLDLPQVAKQPVSSSSYIIQDRPTFSKTPWATVYSVDESYYATKFDKPFITSSINNRDLLTKSYHYEDYIVTNVILSHNYQHHTRLATVKYRSPTMILQHFPDPGRPQMQEALENGIGNMFQESLVR